MTEQPVQKNNKNFLLILAILGAVIILETIVVIYKTRSGKETSQSLRSITNVVPRTKAKGNLQLALDANQAVQAGQNIKAQLLFESTLEPISGADAIITFDPQLVSIVEAVGNKDLFEQIIINRQEMQTGRIKITAYMPKKTLLGKFTLAYFTIKLLKDQPSVLDIEFLGPDRITDSNLVSEKSQLDILGSVLSLKLAPKK